MFRINTNGNLVNKIVEAHGKEWIVLADLGNGYVLAADINEELPAQVYIVNSTESAIEEVLSGEKAAESLVGD